MPNPHAWRLKIKPLLLLERSYLERILALQWSGSLERADLELEQFEAIWKIRNKKRVPTKVPTLCWIPKQSAPTESLQDGRWVPSAWQKRKEHWTIIPKAFWGFWKENFCWNSPRANKTGWRTTKYTLARISKRLQHFLRTNPKGWEPKLEHPLTESFEVKVKVLFSRALCCPWLKLNRLCFSISGFLNRIFTRGPVSDKPPSLNPANPPGVSPGNGRDSGEWKGSQQW